MELHRLPTRTSDAAGNMAADFLLLQRYPHAAALRYRHYTWARPAFTFGYAQKWDFVRSRLPREDERLDITRRPTGGGLVDHREDWTYTLVIPRTHPLWDRPGPVVYCLVHDALTATLNSFGARVRLQTSEPDAEPGVCFERPERGDVVRESDGVKVAGAALKRVKHGVLFQGSLWRPHVPEVDWVEMEEKFPATLARALNAQVTEPGWPELNPDEEQALVDQYASPEWIESR